MFFEQLSKKFERLVAKDYLHWFPDQLFLRWMYRIKTGETLHLKHPITYNEKLQWLKLYNHNPLYTKLVDKYEVRKFVAQRIGEEHLIPLLGVYNDASEINISKLPTQFVLKCNHDSGSVFICKDKSTFDFDAIKKKLNAALKRNYFYRWREWPYKNVKPRIIAESYMEDDSGSGLNDFKIFCFNGEAKLWFYIRNRSIKAPKCDYYDFEGKRLDIQQGYPCSFLPAPKTQNLKVMKTFAERLSQGLPECRMDFYEINGKVYFGEFTFFDSSGFCPFEPKEWNKILGDWITL